MARAIVEVHGADLVATELFATGDRAKSMRPIWPAVFARLEQLERDHFDSFGASSGDPWPPLSQNTLWRKFREGQNLAIMRATDALYNSLTGTTSDSIRIEGDDWAEFGSSLPQMSYQQDPPANANYPTRLPVNISQADTNEMAELMLGYVMGSVGKNLRPLPARGAGGRFVSGT